MRFVTVVGNQDILPSSALIRQIDLASGERMRSVWFMNAAFHRAEMCAHEDQHRSAKLMTRYGRGHVR